MYLQDDESDTLSISVINGNSLAEIQNIKGSFHRAKWNYKGKVVSSIFVY